MGIDVEQDYKEMTLIKQKMFREDLEIILGFFGFKVKEN